MYSKEVMDHFMNPRNVGRVAHANGRAAVGDSKCGVYLEITIKVTTTNDNDLKVKSPYIGDIKFKAFGCVGAISTSSMVTELAKGSHIVEAYQLGNSDILKTLWGLPEEKVHCSLLGIDALRKAIINFAESDEQSKLKTLNDKLIKTELAWVSEH